MSGQRNKKPDDIIKNRQEYLDNLNLEISLQDANEQAVKQYKETGQMPAVTQMKDNRSVEDKLRDYEKLKASIREDLLPIANASMVNNIIQIIQNSPFNKDNGLLIFLAQRAPDIVKNLSKIYKFGIKGDLNDAEQFAQFVIKMYSDKNSMVENTKSIMARLGTNTQTGLAKKATEQSYVLSSLEAEMNAIIHNVSRTINNQAFRRLLLNKQQLISENINTVRSLYPPNLSYQIPRSNLSITLMELENYFNNQVEYNLISINEKNDFQLFLQYLNHNIPNTDYYNTLLTQLKRAGDILKASDNELNRQKFIESINNIYEYIFNTGETNDELLKIKQALDRILLIPNVRQYAQQAMPLQPQGVQAGVPAGVPQRGQDGGDGGDGDGGDGDDEDYDPYEYMGVMGDFVKSIPSMFRRNPQPQLQPQYIDYEEMKHYEDFIEANKDLLVPENRRRLELLKNEYALKNINDTQYLEKLSEYNKKIMDEMNKRRDIDKARVSQTAARGYVGGITRKQLDTRANYIYDLARDRQLDPNDFYRMNHDMQYVHNQIGHAISLEKAYDELERIAKHYLHIDLARHAQGLGKMQGTGFPQPTYNFTKQYVEPTEGVQSDPRYIKFGRYLVNTKSLKDNKLSLRRPKGGVIASLPVYKMSNPFSKVIKKIVGGALPSQDDFSDLTEEELRYLHKVSKESDLSHKIEIPTPSKDEDEKDAHLFNVYKGEIMAGNDNKEMIRKFKLLLMKLSKNNTINKREANEILEMLTTAGY